jgi:hypothetical protein
MADDNTRYRTTDPLGGRSAPVGTNDPLAELARLIGKEGLFADQRHEPRAQAYDERAVHADEGVYRDAEYRPHHDDPPMGNWDREPAPEPSFDDYSHASEEPISLPPLPRMLRPDPPSFSDDMRREEPALAPHDEHRLDLPRFDPPGYSSNQDRYAEGAPPIYPHEPESELPPDDDGYYSDHQASRAPEPERRKGMLTVAAVLALAVVGTAGAFGYRNIVRGTNSASPPPVIRASDEPNKVAPPPATASADQSKFSYDRFSDRGKNEQVVVREEKPVDAQELARSTVPRTVFPGAPVPSTSTRAGTTASANPPGVIGEPRRVRTVPIRPDQAEAPPGAGAQASAVREAEAMATEQQVPAGAARAQQPAWPAVPPPSASRNTPRVAATRPANAPTQSASSHSAGAPLSLTPDNNAAPPPAAAPRAQAPARVASAPAASGGGYLVQVASRRSEADAQASYRSIQSRYGNVLNGQPHVIRQANLGSKGVYYRAMVGPFGSRDEAVRLCTSLKQAGGDCVVQH